eukprot:SAG31_NODE_3704_length_3973_cov_2.604285_3_plen_85_part_01
MATLFVIMFLAHMLACFYYLLGEDSETLGNGLHVAGWVEMEPGWRIVDSNVSETKASYSDCNRPGNVDCRISTTTRYVTSMYYVL